MSSRGYRSDEQDHGAHRAGGGEVAPGKRTMTSALPPPRDIVSFDRFGDYRESRATIDSAPPTTSRLSDRQLRKARERNPHWQGKLGFSTSLFGGGDVATGEFADNVADKQAALGLPVDGIAGPQTLAAVIRGTPSQADDPFAMHLLGMTAPRAGAGKKQPARAPAAAPAAETRVRAEVTDVQPADDGVQLVIGAGATHGIDASWDVHVVGCRLAWKVVDVRAHSIVVVSRRGRVDDVLGLRDVELNGVPRAAAEPAEIDEPAAADAAEPAWWTFED